MTTVATRVRAIADLEGFDLIVKDAKTGKEVHVDKNGVLSGYSYGAALKGSKTVADWKRDRFEASYPGYTCDVLKGDGEVAAPQTTLRVVRESYEEE